MECYSSLAPYYDILMKDTDYDGYVKGVKNVFDEFNIPENGIVLDLGCGTGNITYGLAKLGYDMIGLDISENMLSVAVAKKPQDLSSNVLFIASDMCDFELYGKIDTQDNDLTFEGSTSGTGRVTGNASNTVTYGENAALIYQGEYANLVVRGASTVDADSEVTVNQTMYNGDSLTVDGRLVLNGATAGRGTVNGDSGEIVYNGNDAEQSIYAGLYNDLTIGEDAVGNIDIAGDITINGNAFNRSLRGAELAVSNGTVTYNAAGAQHVMGGTYDELILTGSGTKLMEADLFNVNDFVAGGSSFSNMLTLTSAAPGSLWTLNADSYSINYSIVNYADSYNSVFLNGTNLTGSFNTNNWAVFNSAGGVGSSYPGINNPNFQALAAYMDQLSFEWSDSSRFDIFRRLPVSRPAIVVGDMSDLVMLNSFESYDMIDFDGEFFGNSDGIGLLDEESREVLEDAVSAGGSDLKALLED